MFIRVDDIQPTLTVVIRGNEPWLASIQTALQESDEPSDSKITGEIHFRKDSAGFIYGSGNVKYTPTRH